MRCSRPSLLHSGQSIIAVKPVRCPLGTECPHPCWWRSSPASLCSLRTLSAPSLQLLTMSFLTLLTLCYSRPSTCSTSLPPSLDGKLLGAGCECGLTTSLSGPSSVLPLSLPQRSSRHPYVHWARGRFRGELGCQPCPHGAHVPGGMDSYFTNR